MQYPYYQEPYGYWGRNVYPGYGAPIEPRYQSNYHAG